MKKKSEAKKPWQAWHDFKNGVIWTSLNKDDADILDEYFDNPSKESTMREKLQDIYNCLKEERPLHPGSMIFAEDAPAVEVLGKLLEECK